jgi:hypothetical protein
MTCGSDFRLKKLYLFLHIFLTFSRENSRLGTNLPMMKSVWSHLDFLKVRFGSLFEIDLWASLGATLSVDDPYSIVFINVETLNILLFTVMEDLQFASDANKIAQCCSQAGEHPV